MTSEKITENPQLEATRELGDEPELTNVGDVPAERSQLNSEAANYSEELQRDRKSTRLNSCHT